MSNLSFLASFIKLTSLLLFILSPAGVNLIKWLFINYHWAQHWAKYKTSTLQRIPDFSGKSSDFGVPYNWVYICQVTQLCDYRQANSFLWDFFLTVEIQQTILSFWGLAAIFLHYNRWLHAKTLIKRMTFNLGNQILFLLGEHETVCILNCNDLDQNLVKVCASES